MTRDSKKRYDYDAQWSPVWPTEPGWFWFYGSELGSEPRLMPIEVWGPVRNSGGGSSLLYSAGSHFISTSDAVGVWTKLETPNIPYPSGPTGGAS